MTRSQRPVWLGEDRRQWDHVRVHIAVLRDDRVGAYELAVYLGIAAHAETASGDAYPSATTLARYGGMSERRARQSIDALVEAGWVAVDERPGQASILRLLPPPRNVVQGSEPGTPEPDAGPPCTTFRGTPAPRSDELEPLNENQERELESSSHDADQPPTDTKIRGSRLPDPWSVTQEMREWAASECPGVDWRDQTRRFCDYWRAQPGQRGRKVDWVATWRNWLRRASDDASRASRGRPASAQQDAIAAYARTRGVM